jgi:ATP-dependent DNA ligase
MNLPVLYNIDKKGSTRMWEIKTSGDTIHVTHGLQDGEKIKTTEKVKGKNIGRANETTDAEQAVKEATSKWNKKKDLGYVEDLQTKNETANLKPMLAHEYKKQKAKVIYPVFVQPKLDGYRALYDGKNDKILSRAGKEYKILYGTQLYKDLQKYKNITLDGELYVHDKDFQFEIYGILRKKKLGKDDAKTLDKIQYHVYDIMNEAETFEKRNITLAKLTETNHIKPVLTYFVKNSSDLDEVHKKFVADGYEGTMIRNKKGMYIHNRSTDLLKYKDFDDNEFKVVGFEKETDTKGDGATPVVWVCQTVDKKEFRVPSKGTREERSKLYENGKKYIGKMLTVQYFGLTNDNIPRFPKTLRAGASSFL